LIAKINDQKTIHEGRVFRLLRENITLPNSATVDTDIVYHPGATAIVPLTGNNTIILLWQYRHAIRKYIWEIPAGTLDPGESVMDCAKRELTEETGMSAEKWNKLGEYLPAPGYSNERIHLFLAWQLTEKEQKTDEDELFEVHEMGIQDVRNMLLNGEIEDGKTMTGLFLFFQQKKAVD
jgi:ADP-ribose pyrophosphatase